MTPAAKRYSFAFTGFMLAYAGVVIGVPFLDRAFDFAIGDVRVESCLELEGALPLATMLSTEFGE